MNEGAALTTKTKLLHFAAQVDQLKNELRYLQHESATSVGLSANHMMGTIQSLLGVASSRLTELAGRV